MQDIARDVGISHPAILHHFESRAGLVNALVDRTTSQLREKLLGVLDGEDDQKIGAQMPSLVKQTRFEALSDQGTAKLLSWMLLTDSSPEGNPTTGVMTEIADRGHAARCKLADSENVPHPNREEPCFWCFSSQTQLLARQLSATISMRPAASATIQRLPVGLENGWARCSAPILSLMASPSTKAKRAQSPPRRHVITGIPCQVTRSLLC